MKLEVAKQLIEGGINPAVEKQVWVELGSGDGLFTYALSALLPDHSTIYVVDEKETSLMKVRARPTIVLNKIHSNFEDECFSFENLDGVLMANAFHFVKNKERLLKSLKARLTADARVVIVEYEMRGSNRWVPYPIPFDKLKILADSLKFKNIKKLFEIPSLYENRMIYSSVLVA